MFGVLNSVRFDVWLLGQTLFELRFSFWGLCLTGSLKAVFLFERRFKLNSVRLQVLFVD